jgi:hypothetical protein
VLSTFFDTIPSAPNRQACAKTAGPSSAMCSLNRMPASVLQPRQRRLAIEEWTIAHILAVILDEVEGLEDRRIGGLPTAQFLEPDKPSGPSTKASPSIVKLLALTAPPSAIARSRAVQSFALRL